MIPSSSVEELEEAFNTAKNALETELSFKEEQLQVCSCLLPEKRTFQLRLTTTRVSWVKVTRTKAEREREARRVLEKELEVLREKIRMTEQQTLSSLSRFVCSFSRPRFFFLFFATKPRNK